MNSAIGKLYPSTKFAVLLLLVILSVFTPGYTLQYLMFLVVLFFSLCAGTARQFLGTFFKSIFIIIIFIFAIQVFIISNEDAQPIWAFIHFSQTGLNDSLSMTSKIVAISSLVICFFQVTDIKDITFALEKSGTPRKVTFLISSTIQLIPQMSALSKTITDAQKSRGIETEGSLLIRAKAFVPMLGPLVLSSIQQTEERMLALDPEIVILDEPTSQLDPKSTEDIFEIVKLLKEQGKTIILVEHKVDLVAEYCDHILLLADGQVAMQGKTEEILTDPQVLVCGGQLPQVVLYFLEREKRTGKKNKIPLTVQNVSFAYPNGYTAVEDVSMAFEKGEAVAIIGQNGAGKTTTVKLMNGLLRPTKGEVLIEGQSTADKTTATIARKVGYVFQNPDDQIFQESIYKEISYGLVKQKMAPEEVKRRTLDEPTAGQDRKSTELLGAIVAGLAKKGKIVITITHDMEFVVKYFKRVIVMAEKKKRRDASPREIFWDEELLRFSSLKQPYLCQLANLLGHRDILTIGELLEVTV